MSSVASASLAIVGVSSVRDVPKDARVQAILAAFHERHVPLTPSLATSLAALETARIPTSVVPWTCAFACIGIALGSPGRFGHSAAVLARPEVFLTRVVEPIVRRAAQNLGSVVLIGPAEWRPDGSLTEDYSAYCRRIEGAVDQLMKSPEAMGLGFWAAAGLALNEVAKTRVRRDKTAPERRLDPMRAKCVFGIEPLIPADAMRKFRDLKPRARAEKDRSGIRPKEGGVRGMIQTNRMEDFGDAALSELMQDKTVLMNKLLHEGFLMRHRPPRRNPKRLLLSVTCVEGADRSDTVTAMLAGAWADCALRAQIMLTLMGLEESDLVWVEPTAQGMGAVRHDVENAPKLPAVNPLSLSGDPRRANLTKNGLGLQLCDRDLLLDAAPKADIAQDDVEPPSLAQVLSALAQQSGAKGDLDPDDYAMRLVIEICATQSVQGARSFQEAKQAHAARMGYGNSSMVRLVRISLPDVIAPLAVMTWQHGTTGQLSQDVQIADPVTDLNTDPIEQVFGQVSVWMLQSIREVFDGAT